MRIWVATLALVITVPFTAEAQNTATATTNAPIYVTNAPAPSVTPLRVAAVGTVFRIVGQQGDWLQVEFADPQLGRRVGWVQKTNVRVSDPNLRPMDLSLWDTSASDAPVKRENVDASRVSEPVPDATSIPSSQPGSSPSNQSIGDSQAREGFWFNVGLGVGSLGCENCIERANGLSGGLSLGTRVTDRLLLGVGTTGWAKEEDGETLTVGTLDARLRFYPARTSGFFLTGGVGVGSIRFAGDSEFGLGVVVGVGWDIRVGRNVSLTPFYNGFAMSNSTADANVGQLGLGVTIH